ncbi:P-type conjugative transfer protein TrbG [Sphingosinicella sp. CPCC 101087]|uniref:P-type conjugative transfer protein TrbG n=1 Tax=Sphingosinicella sp. CPCC 101087 TaxID=2497754 RepID=UPI00101D23C9|nr:P-type conjugative transfer protein TrbG [Sphingosinicella sp. CPCC 101087]
MKTPSLILSASALGLGACAGHGRVEAAPVAVAVEFTQAVMAPQAVLGTQTPPPTVQWLSGDGPPTASDSGPGWTRGGPAARIAAANSTAVREPSRDRYVNAVQIYPWSEGAVYRLYTAPERVSAIALQPGETLVSVAAGDTVRWVIGDTTSGTGAERRSHVLVKPSAVGLRTNLVITTDRRVYHVEVESDARPAMTGISWTYPAEALLALRRGDVGAAAATVAAGIAVEALDFGYRIEGDDPPWRPIRAFDDGQQVYIQFPADLAQSEAPPLFVSGASGQSELVNYRLRGHYYVVDRLFAAAELRLGERRQQVVRIVRMDVDGSRRRRGSST